MSIKKLTPNLIVTDVKETVDFYHRVLGFEVKTFYPEWAHLAKDDCEIMFQPAASLIKEFPELSSSTMGGSLTLFFRLDDPAALFERVKDEANIIRPLGVTSYNGATEFVVRDLNGYILHFSDVVLD